MTLIIRTSLQYIPMLIPMIALYVVRLWWWNETYVKFPIRPPWVIFQLLAQIIILGIIGVVVASFLLLIVLLSKYVTKSTKPSRFLFLGLGLTLLLPLPQPPLLPEVAHFLDYQTDYQNMLNIVLNDKRLDTQNAFCVPIPDSLQHLSTESCVETSYVDSGLFVRFNPIGYDYPIVYIERDHEVKFCLFDFYIEQKLDDHWYVCYEDWN